MRAVSDVTRNNATLTVTGSSGTNAPAAGTSQAWTVAALPASFGVALGTGETLRLVDSTAGASTGQQAEIVLLTASAGAGATSIAVTRGVEGTTPVPHSTGATFAAVVTKAVFDGLPAVSITKGLGWFVPTDPRFGAKGDGATDDSAAINAAITTANAAHGAVWLSAGVYLVNSTINLGSGTLSGAGSLNEGSGSGRSQLLAGTAGMTVLAASALSRISNIGVQGNDVANIGIHYDQAPRAFTENVEVYRCRKSSYVLAKTQNSCFVNCFSQYSVWAFTLANGARNNSFYHCTAGNPSRYYHDIAMGVTWANTGILRFAIDERDSDFGGSAVTMMGNDRNLFTGGIFEQAPIAIKFENLSSFAGIEAQNNQFYGVEFTCSQILDTRIGHPGPLLMDSCCYIVDTQDSAWGLGTNGYVRFQGEPFFSGGNNLARRGVTQGSNYCSLFVIDLDQQSSPSSVMSDGGGTFTFSETTREIALLSGNTMVRCGPNVSVVNSLTLNQLTVPGFTAIATFTIKRVGANPVLVYVPLNGSPWRRQVGSYAAAGTYSLPIHIGDATNDSFGLAFGLNGSASGSVVIKGVTMKAAGGW
jgi:Pectate lyase superfamily protein